MHSLYIVSFVGVLVVILTISVLVIHRWLRPSSKRLNAAQFQEHWKEVQRLCSANETWPLAIINADKLVDQALKSCRIKGKTMGERLVSAQRRLSDNDGVWFGHKLRNRVVHEEMSKLRQRDVQTALRGFRQALKDLGALI